MYQNQTLYSTPVVILFDRPSDSQRALVKEVLSGSQLIRDFDLNQEYVLDHPAIVGSLYLAERPWPEQLAADFLSRLRRLSDFAEQSSTGRVVEIILDHELPELELLRGRSGLWVPMRLAEMMGLWGQLIEIGAEQISRWFFVPFKTSDTDYELCPPDEKIMAFGHRINGTERRASVPASLKIRMAEGYRITDYVAAAFADSLSPFKELGGESILLTTLLQMNDKLGLVNHYSERLERPEELNLYSLAAMNLSLADPQDENDIAVLVTSGKLVVEDIKLGG
jgi:hypothetical protein